MLREERYLQAHETWTQFTVAVGAVSVAGPRAVAAATNHLSDVVFELDAAGTDWRDALKAGRQRGFRALAERFDAAMESVQEPRAAFRQAVRNALRTD